MGQTLNYFIYITLNLPYSCMYSFISWPINLVGAVTLPSNVSATFTGTFLLAIYHEVRPEA